MQCIIICHCNPSKHWQYVCYVILKDSCLCRMIYRTTDFVLNAPFTSLDQILSHTCKTSEHQQLWLIRLSLNIILPLNSSACAVLNKKLSPHINTDHALHTQTWKWGNDILLFMFSPPLKYSRKEVIYDSKQQRQYFCTWLHLSCKYFLCNDSNTFSFSSIFLKLNH